MVTSAGGSAKTSAVARCTASSVRIGSRGKGRRMRASTARSTSRMKQRRSKVRRARTAACSSPGLNRPAARARMIARPASAKVRADVTSWVPAGSGFKAAESCSSSAATSALDSMYRMLTAAAFGWRAGVTLFRAERRRGTLRFATIAVDQFSGGARRQPNVRPVFEWVTSFHRRMKRAGRYELVPPACWRRADTASWRHEFSDHTPVGGHHNPLASFDSTDVSTQVVLQLAYAGLHRVQYSHMWPQSGHVSGRAQDEAARHRGFLAPFAQVDYARAFVWVVLRRFGAVSVRYSMSASSSTSSQYAHR